MSAPATDLPSSISSSGHSDGLGRRLLAFDRETGSIRERLYLRPELSAFEVPLRRRVQLLATFEDERFARPCAVQRDPVSGELTVISEFIAGSRLSDLIETAQDASWVPGVDAALGFLLEALPALSSFHSVLSISHGLIDPTRIAITPGGQVVFLDTPFGEVVERLMLSRARLWLEFGLAVRPSMERVRLDAASDIRQVALSAVTLVLGRRVRSEDLPGSLPAILAEVVEVAHIRGGAQFASGLQHILQRCLQLDDGAPYRKTDEVVAEVRSLVAQEIGEHVCHLALVEFLEQMDAACDALPDDSCPQSAEDAAAARLEDTAAMEVTGTPDLSGDAKSGHPVPPIVSLPGFDATRLSDAGAAGISLDAQTFAERETPVDRTTRVEEVAPEFGGSSGRSATAMTPASAAPGQPAQPSVQAHEAGAAQTVAPREAAARPASADQQSADPAPDDTTATNAQAAASESSRTGSVRRRKRHQRSARERKDKLRSVSAERGPSAPKAPARTSPWIVSPAKAAAFDPMADQPAEGAVPPRRPEPVSGPSTLPVPLPVFPSLPVTPLPAAIPAKPAAPNPPVGTVPVAAPVAAQTVPIAPVPAPPRLPREPVPGPGALRIKSEPPPGFNPKRTKETVSTQPYIPQGPLSGARQSARFPSRLAAVLLVIVAAAVVAGRSYLPARGETPDVENAASGVEPPVVVAPQPESGEIVVRSQPAGVRVLLDGKPVGETPLKLTAVSTGRHVLTFASAAGEVTQPVRVAAGETLEVEVPLFSGWLAVFAPIVLDVSLNGRSLGTTEQTRLMLPPGRHKVTLANRELGYRAAQTVEIRPGEVESVTIEPRGRVNLNANPWAEVWLDGRRLGDTPIADIQIPLGVREFVFRHPDHGERKATAIVRADQPTAVSIDFTRSSFN